MISVTQLTRTFGSLLAVDSISFEIQVGEVVGLLGPNGAGKTTTLRILAGYMPASSGSARVAGFDVLTDSLEVRRRIGYLPESVPLYREHRVIEMLEFQARLHQLPRAERRARIGQVLERVGLADRARDLIGNLSRGLRQRAGLAVALLSDPKVLILDEPTSGLDPLQRIEVRELIRALAVERTVVISSHILPEIEATCPRVIILNKGRIAADGAPAKLVSQLARSSHVRLEAVVGHDPAAAVRMLGALRGVREVRQLGRLGIHHQFELACEEDLREDVGALAGAKGWALRELSWARPTLEQLFARIALGHADEVLPVAGGTAPSVAQGGLVALTLGAQPSAAMGPTTQTAVRVATHGQQASAPSSPPAVAAQKVVYNLNPFDMGAARDLGRPKAVEPAPTLRDDAGQNSRSDAGPSLRSDAGPSLRSDAGQA